MSNIETVSELIAHILQKIHATDIENSPFPHLIIASFLPDTFYSDVLDAIPEEHRLERVEYPGTGFGRKDHRYRAFGYAYTNLANDSGPLGLMHDALDSEPFARALLGKFVLPVNGKSPIPEEKHAAFCNGARDFTTVFDLQIDLPGYAIPPHADISSKIVTFQLYLTRDDQLADFGTQLCVPKDKRAKRGRNRFARTFAHAVELLPQRTHLYRRIERSAVGLQLGVGSTKNWLPWSWFDMVKTAEALPNHFFAFAPNASSFHSVDMRIPPGRSIEARPVIRGFIRSGSNTRNWIAPHSG